MTQMVVLCMSGSKTVTQWQNIREIAQEIPHYPGKLCAKLQNNDMLTSSGPFQTAQNLI